MGITSAIFNCASPRGGPDVISVHSLFRDQPRCPSTLESTIRIIPQTRFDLVLAFECLDEHRENRSFEGIITGYERFARMFLCQFYQSLTVLLIFPFSARDERAQRSAMRFTPCRATLKTPSHYDTSKVRCAWGRVSLLRCDRELRCSVLPTIIVAGAIFDDMISLSHQHRERAVNRRGVENNE